MLFPNREKPVETGTRPPFSFESDAYAGRPSWQLRLVSALLPVLRRRKRSDGPDAMRKNLERAQRRIVREPDASLTGLCRTEKARLNGMDAVVLEPLRAPAERDVFYLHGGGYVSGPYAEHWRLLNHLAHAARARIYAVRYPLATEAPHPAALDAAVRAWSGLALKNKGRDITLLGDSAGAGLALALARRLADLKIPAPARIVAISPWLDLSLGHPDLPRYAALDPMLHIPSLRMAATLYAGDHPQDDPFLSPKHLSLNGMPPALLMTGGRDAGYPDSLDFMNKAREAGYALTVVEAPYLIHVWPAGIGYYPEARTGIRQIAEFMIYGPGASAGKG